MYNVVEGRLQCSQFAKRSINFLDNVDLSVRLSARIPYIPWRDSG